VEDLWLGPQRGQVVTTIALNGFRGDPQTLPVGISGSVEIVNHADAISHALHLYRSSASVTTSLFYGAVILLLAFRYGIARLWRVVTPPLLGAIGALATLGVMGIPINVFSMFALMVLLGVSVDYVIFFAEETHPEGAPHLSVFLSALTTIVSFGALSWSSTSALQSFGIVLSVGVFFAALLAPLASHRGPER
jgi:predicted exporter